MATTSTLPATDDSTAHQAATGAPDRQTQIPEHESHTASIFEAPFPFVLWHLASFDAPTVAVVWCLAFGRTAHSPHVPSLPFWLPAILGLSAWSLYIADRLLDAWPRTSISVDRISPIAALQPRHRFHWKHRRLLIPIAVASASIAVALVLRFMTLSALVPNSTIALAALGYLAAIHLPIRSRFKIPKELLVAIIFTSACALPVIAMTSAHSFLFTPITLVFTGLAWLNCHAIEVWESGDKETGSDFAPTKSKLGVLTRLSIATIAIIFSTATLSLALAFAALGERRLGALIASAATSTVLLGLLDRIRKRLTPTTLRAAADLVLLTPIAILLPGVWS